MRSPGLHRRGRELRALVDLAETGRADVHAVRVPPLDHLGVAGDDLDAGRLGRSGNRLDLGPQLIGGRPSSRISDEAERLRAGPGHGEVVDRPVDGELADRAAGEAHRADDEAVGGQGQAEAVDRSPPRRPHLLQRLASRAQARAGPRSASGSPCRRRRAPS